MANSIRHISLLLIGIFLLQSIGCSSANSSPQAVFDKAKKAAANQDYKTVATCWSESTQKQFCSQIVAVYGSMSMMKDLPVPPQAKEQMMGKMKPVLEEMEQLMKSEGITDDQLSGVGPRMMNKASEVAGKIKDRPLFIGTGFKLMLKMQELSPQGKNTNPMDEFANSELKDVTIDGDKASGKHVIDGKERKVEFIKENGSWKMHMDSLNPNSASMK